MLQTHTLILWADAYEADFEESLEKTYTLLKLLKESGLGLDPKYLPAMRKKDAKTFELTKTSLAELLRKGVHKEGKVVFPDLGYRTHFFSSFNDNDSAGIMLGVGVSNPRFYNTCVVELPISLKIYDEHTIERLMTLFKKSIVVFDPFWGCIGNSVNSRRYGGYYGDELPITVHWINYFGSRLSKFYGDKMIVSAPVYSAEKFHKGYFIELKEKPINDDVKEDIALQQQANKYFKL